MNERIEHITKQVDEYFDDLSIEFSRQAWMEKFAELIIRECADISDASFHNESAGYTAILKYFGVAE